jgi:hypothetical protein
MTRDSLRSEAWLGLPLALLLATCRGSDVSPSPPAATASVSPAAGPSAAAPDVGFAELLEYARRANAAYQDEPAIRAVAGPGAALTVSNLPGVDVRVFVEVDEARRRQWVAVRGTANLRNVAEDAEYLKVEARELGIHVHEGFLMDARKVWSFARPLLRPGLETRITGHSLGGALAVLLAMRLHVEGVPVARVVTFGQPKVTNKAGVGRFRELALLRVVNHDDPVPLLPWETLEAAEDGFFRHLGTELRLTDRGSWQFFAEHRAERFLLTSFLAHLGRENPKEHEMAGYLARLEALAIPAAAEGAP